jgi:hypothetical protein
MRAVPGSGKYEQAGELSDVIDVVLKPGEMSLHDSDILHGSNPNGSLEKRVGFAIRFMTPEAHLRSRTVPVAVLARGHAAGNHFRLAEPPIESSEQHALSEMRSSATAHLDAILHNLKSSSEPRL